MLILYYLKLEETNVQQKCLKGPEIFFNQLNYMCM